MAKSKGKKKGMHEMPETGHMMKDSEMKGMDMMSGKGEKTWTEKDSMGGDMKCRKGGYCMGNGT